MTDPERRDEPLAKRVARAVLYKMHEVMPEAAYEAVYSRSFKAYKAALASAYSRRVAQHEADGDLASVLRGNRVASVMPWSLVGAGGLEQTHDLAQALVRHGVPGAFVECGVAQGGCAALIAQVAAAENAGRHCWFVDSYEGLPDPTEEDFAGEDGRTGDHTRPLPRGSCLGTIEQVSELLFERFGLHPDRISLVKGWFQDSLPTARSKIGQIALLRVDGDWYDSTKCVLDNLYDQVSVDGQIIIDDYGTCHGAKRATDEFRADRGIDTPLIPDGRGGVSFRKPATATATAKPARKRRAAKAERQNGKPLARA